VRRAAWEITQTAVQAALLYLLVTTFVGRFEIHQISMEPNFHEGQRVVVSQLGSVLSPWVARVAYAADGSRGEGWRSRAAALLGPERGQVVVFYPDAERRQDPLIKRAIGLPGETVEVHDGGVFVDGQRLDEPYVHSLETVCYSPCGPVRLGPDEYFMLGDNRPNSRDSRSFGPVHLDQIIGRVVLRYWPLEAVQFYP
jgi:signal peptidase I